MNETFYGEALYPLEQIDKIRTYQYSGSDASLIYKYFYGKTAQYLVDHVIPPSIA
jgi:hypothetical protein